MDINEHMIFFVIQFNSYSEIIKTIEMILQT